VTRLAFLQLSESPFRGILPVLLPTDLAQIHTRVVSSATVYRWAGTALGREAAALFAWKLEQPQRSNRDSPATEAGAENQWREVVSMVRISVYPTPQSC
jgi:hypothetical protein